MINANGVSVVIFCFNSEKFIQRNLKCIFDQDIPANIPCEVLVVDNNSTDRTYELATSILRSSSTSFDYQVVKEHKQGLNFAREKAISVAKYEIMVFVDDDNFLSKDYLRRAYDFMITHPKAGICGSQSIAEYEKEPEVWFQKYEAAIAIGKQGNGVENLTASRKFVWGAGMIIRRSLAQKAFSFGFNFINSGRKGYQLGSSEDIELCYAFIALKTEIYYNDDLKLIHYIPSFRVQWDYVQKIILGYGASTIWLDIFEWFQKGQYVNMPARRIYFLHHLSVVKNFIQKGIRSFLGKIDPENEVGAKRRLVTKGRLRLFYKIRPDDYYSKVSLLKIFYSNCRKDDLS